MVWEMSMIRSEVILNRLRLRLLWPRFTTLDLVSPWWTLARVSRIAVSENISVVFFIYIVRNHQPACPQ